MNWAIYQQGHRPPPSVSVPSALAVPSLVQLVASDLNDNNGIHNGNDYKFSLPNVTQAGNCLVLTVAYPYSASRTISIVDSAGDTWPAATITQGTASVGNMRVSVFVLPNASAGLHILTVTFDAGLFPFQYTMAEFVNCTGADGSQGANSVAGPNISAGSYTPTTNNDANGGHLLWTYAISNDTVGTTTSTQASAMSATNGAALSHANNVCTIPSVSSTLVQAANAAINPGFSVTQSSGTNFVVASVALKAGNAGSAAPAGIRIKRLLHYTMVNPIAGDNTVLFPCDGNLLVVTSAICTALTGNKYNSISDSNGQTYTARNAAADCQFFDKTNATPGNSLSLTINVLSGGTANQHSLQCWDVVGAATSPFDVSAGFNGNAPASGTVFNDFPDITPTVAPGLTIVRTGMGTASRSGMASGAPSGAIFDTVDYTNETDLDRMDNCDYFGHVNYPTTAAQTWNWVLGAASHSSTANATAVTYKAA